MTDRNRVPRQLYSLIPLLDEWAIADDLDRSLKVQDATTEQLQDLITQVDTADQEMLYGWLSGPESRDPVPSAEYMAFTCLTMAADEARVRGETACTRVSQQEGLWANLLRSRERGPHTGQMPGRLAANDGHSRVLGVQIPATTCGLVGPAAAPPIFQAGAHKVRNQVSISVAIGPATLAGG